jgi:hypothetical protein
MINIDLNHFRQLNIYTAATPDRMHMLDLGLFHYQIDYTRKLLQDKCKTGIVDEFDQRLSKISRFPRLKIFKNGLENIKRFTADEFRNMMNIMVFVIEGLILKYWKPNMSLGIANGLNKHLINVYINWCLMYLISRQDCLTKVELISLQVLYLIIFIS